MAFITVYEILDVDPRVAARNARWRRTGEILPFSSKYSAELTPTQSSPLGGRKDRVSMRWASRRGSDSSSYKTPFSSSGASYASSRRGSVSGGKGPSGMAGGPGAGGPMAAGGTADIPWISADDPPTNEYFLGGEGPAEFEPGASLGPGEAAPMEAGRPGSILVGVSQATLAAGPGSQPAAPATSRLPPRTMGQRLRVLFGWVAGAVGARSGAAVAGPPHEELDRPAAGRILLNQDPLGIFPAEAELLLEDLGGPAVFVSPSRDYL
ncbi:hypothetical protein H696_06367, partial [Fonticula alba]